MLERIQEEMIWHLPGSDRRYAGQFVFDPGEDCTLQTSVGFDVRDWKFFDASEEYEIILGVDSAGKPWTLVGCVIARLGTQRITWRIGQALRGSHFSNRPGIQFDSMVIELPFLNQWFGRRSIMEDYDAQRWWVEFKDSLIVDLPGKEAQVEFRDIVSREMDYQPSRLRLGARTDTIVRPKAPQKLDWFTDFQFILVGLLTLFIGKKPWSIRLCGSINEQEVEIFARQTWAVARDSLHVEEATVRYNDIRADFVDVFNQWIRVSDQSREALDLLDGYQSNPDGFLQNKLLMLTTSFEVLHRKLHRGTYMSEERYNQLWPEITKLLPDELSEDHRAALKMRLKYGNEFSLRKRFREVLSELPPFIKEYFPEQFIGPVVAWRNQFTHYSDEKLPEADLGVLKDIYSHCRRLEALITILLLNHCGIDMDIIGAGLARSPRFRNLVAKRKPSKKDGDRKKEKAAFSQAFWDYPDYQQEADLRSFLDQATETERDWVMARMLMYGRVKDTLQLFSLTEIKERLHRLPLREDMGGKIWAKWYRIFEVYGTVRK